MNTMLIFSAAWPIVAALATAAFIFANRQEENSAIWALLIFVSLSFFHTILFTFSTIEMTLWVSTMGGNLSQKIALAIVLAAFLLHTLADRSRLALVDKRIELSFPAIALVLAIIGYATHSPMATAQWFIDAGSHLTFLTLIIVLLALAPRVRRIEGPKFLILALCCLIVMSILVGFYEVAYGRAWAVYSRADGLIVSRASGLQFNPNLFGGWLGFAFLLTLRAKDVGNLAWARPLVFVAIGVGLFLSGSRGASICLAASAIAAIVVGWRNAWKVISQYLYVGLGFGAILTCSLVIQGTPFTTLALRWLDVPLAVAEIVLPSGAVDTVAKQIGEVAGATIQSSAAYDDKELAHVSEAQNLEIAVTGRFSGELRDNGFLAAFDAGGPLAAAGLVFLFAAVAIFLARASRRGSEALRSNMWALYAYILIWSMQARAFQVYPIWVFMAIGITILLRDSSSVRSRGAERTNAVTMRVGEAV
ncbi:hypothetical protein RPD_0754 [Rhodopseudomonas palustris BisB5]|uniref:Uncharacterized protein n=1 Tax=Rhodopseudomonas palustris (strain BisB5) TaxID=316057 RepID=Q13D47_RHOPS|nr:hypothetical protein RPD_0754 [Rhodopseudomonas palustris BisB5]